MKYKYVIFILLLIPNLGLALDTYTDIYWLGEHATRVMLTVDPHVTIIRFRDYLFDSQGINEAVYKLELNGSELHPDSELGDFNRFSNKSLFFTVKKRTGMRTCECPCD